MLSHGNFRFTKADTDDLKEKIYRLRYRIYVEEFGFEKAEDHEGGRETDDYEAHAVQFAALNREGDVVGTIRLILHSENGFPIEHGVKTRFPGEKPPPEKIGEVSRLAVSRMYRRRRDDGQYGVESYLTKSEGGALPDQGPVPEEYKRRKTPVIIMGLYQIMYHESKRRGLTHWYMITEEKVFNTFKKFGFLFYPIGEPVDYHGLRTPYLGVISHMENKLMQDNPLMMKIMLRGLEKEYRPDFSVWSQMKMVSMLPDLARRSFGPWKESFS